LEITILISIHILIRWNIQASVALAAMEANDIASVYFSEISMCCQRSATTEPTCDTEHQVSGGATASGLFVQQISREGCDFLPACHVRTIMKKFISNDLLIATRKQLDGHLNYHES
jgi:hypothetical protein